LESLEELAGAGAQRLQGVLELAAAEVQLAALSGLTMLLLVTIASAALVVAWGLAVACALYLFSGTALGWPLPAICISVGHVVLAYYLWHVTVRLSRNLALPKLRRAALGTPRELQETEKRDEAVALVVPGRS
jgi:hypothetical protein